MEGRGKPKDPATYSIVGQSVPRIDLAPKILGRATYSTDVRVPGMLHGRVIRPAGAGATLESIDESSVKHIPGYVKTVTKGNFVGVIAETEWSAIRAAKELKVNWSAPAARVAAPAVPRKRRRLWLISPCVSSHAVGATQSNSGTARAWRCRGSPRKRGEESRSEL